MFRDISFVNYRTHRKSSISLHPITLLVGNNNSGKSNILQGLQHLSRLVWRSHPRRSRAELSSVHWGPDFFRHKYRMAKDDEPLAWSVTWEEDGVKVGYELELVQVKSTRDFVRCRERIEHMCGSGACLEIVSGYEGDSDRLELQTKVDGDRDIPVEARRNLNTFFDKLGGAFAYHFQPSHLNNSLVREAKIDPYKVDEMVRIPSKIGYEGGNFQRLLFYAKEREERVFSRFVALVRRFNDDFHSVRLNENGIPIWEFDFGCVRSDRLLEEFTPDLLSDGFLKAAAIALMVSLDRPPSLIMLEEIENGINPGNIREVMHWLWQAASTHREIGRSQFLLTSHSPTVLREFSEKLDSVYTLRLDRPSHQSDVRNLNDSLETLVGIGAVEGEFRDDASGNRKVKIPPYQLTELWYSGTIG